MVRYFVVFLCLAVVAISRAGEVGKGYDHIEYDRVYSAEEPLKSVVDAMNHYASRDFKEEFARCLAERRFYLILAEGSLPVLGPGQFGYAHTGMQLVGESGRKREMIALVLYCTWLQDPSVDDRFKTAIILHEFQHVLQNLMETKAEGEVRARDAEGQLSSEGMRAYFKRELEACYVQALFEAKVGYVSRQFPMSEFRKGGLPALFDALGRSIASRPSHRVNEEVLFEIAHRPYIPMIPLDEWRSRRRK